MEVWIGLVFSGGNRRTYRLLLLSDGCLLHMVVPLYVYMSIAMVANMALKALKDLLQLVYCQFISIFLLIFFIFPYFLLKKKTPFILG